MSNEAAEKTPWQFFTEHPLPWEVSRTSAGVAIEDANNEVLWRFDHFDSATPEAFAKALNAVVSVEEVPYIRGYNVGWDDAERQRSAGAAPLDPDARRHHPKMLLRIEGSLHWGVRGSCSDIDHNEVAAEYTRLSEGTDR